MNTLLLPTGREIRMDLIELDPGTQQFFYGALNVTPYLSPTQMRTFPGFDVERANREASDAGRIARGETPYINPSTDGALTLFVQGVGNDLSKLATDTRDFIGLGPENTGKGSPLLRWALLAGAVFLAWQLGLFAWARKKLTA